jgi:hypothetical protein
LTQLTLCPLLPTAGFWRVSGNFLLFHGQPSTWAEEKTAQSGRQQGRLDPALREYCISRWL